MIPWTTAHSPRNSSLWTRTHGLGLNLVTHEANNNGPAPMDVDDVNQVGKGKYKGGKKGKGKKGGWIPFRYGGGRTGGKYQKGKGSKKEEAERKARKARASTMAPV